MASLTKDGLTVESGIRLRSILGEDILVIGTMNFQSSETITSDSSITLPTLSPGQGRACYCRRTNGLASTPIYLPNDGRYIYQAGDSITYTSYSVASGGTQIASTSSGNYGTTISYCRAY